MQTMQGAKVEWIDGGHLATLTYAEEYAKRTDAFLKELDKQKQEYKPVKRKKLLFTSGKVAFTMSVILIPLQ